MVLIVSCAEKKLAPVYTICVLDLDKGISKCGGKNKEYLAPNPMMNGYICSPPDDYEYYLLGCEQDKIDLKNCLSR